jgi:hypothetical protein
MARLVRRSDAREVIIGGHTRLGRAVGSGVVLTGGFVSAEHASIRWTGDEWEVRDLGSRNGTLVDGVRVDPGQPVRIDVGSVLELGDASETWTVVEADAPGLIATRVGGEELVQSARDILALPSPERCVATVFAEATGAYVLESSEGERRLVHDGEVVDVGGARWRITLPSVLSGTPTLEASRSLASMLVRFHVSQDEERVELELIQRGRGQRLPHQWHGYTLLTLARLREQAKDVLPEERGWVDRDRLLKMLKLDTNALNVAIHGARAELAAAGVVDAAAIVEVRRGQRRFGTDRFEVVRA